MVFQKRFVSGHQAHAGQFARHRIELLDHTQLPQHLFDLRQEFRTQGRSRFVHKKLGDRCIAPFQYALGVLHRHGLYRLHQGLLSQGNSLFGGTVHLQGQGIELLTHTQRFEHFCGLVQGIWQANAHFVIAHETILNPEQTNRRTGSFFQSQLQSF